MRRKRERGISAHWVNTFEKRWWWWWCVCLGRAMSNKAIKIYNMYCGSCIFHSFIFIRSFAKKKRRERTLTKKKKKLELIILRVNVSIGWVDSTQWRLRALELCVRPLALISVSIASLLFNVASLSGSLNFFFSLWLWLGLFIELLN